MEPSRMPEGHRAIRATAAWPTAPAPQAHRAARLTERDPVRAAPTEPATGRVTRALLEEARPEQAWTRVTAPPGRRPETALVRRIPTRLHLMLPCLTGMVMAALQEA